MIIKNYFIEVIGVVIVLEKCSESIVEEVKEIMQIFNFDLRWLECYMLEIGSNSKSLSIKRPKNYFKVPGYQEFIDSMNLYTCERIWNKIFHFIDYKRAEAYSSEGNRYLYYLSRDVSGFKQARVRAVIIHLYSCLYRLFGELYNGGHVAHSFEGGYLHLNFNLLSLSELELRICFLFILTGWAT
jgi:hypothetical protein|tara:strand:+ start:1239 stop:1793 length:555 start_codon:yes stop_codon:yes gene_type:complete